MTTDEDCDGTGRQHAFDGEAEPRTALVRDLQTTLADARRRLDRLEVDGVDAVRDALDDVERAVARVSGHGDVGQLRTPPKGKETDACVPAGEVALGVAAERAWAQVPTGDIRLVVRDGRALCADLAVLESLLVALFEYAVAGATARGVAVRSPVAAGTPGYAASRAVAATRPQPWTVVVGGSDDGFYVETDRPSADSPDPDWPANRGRQLAVAERLATAHGWEVTVELGATGGGTRLEVTGRSA